MHVDLSVLHVDDLCFELVSSSYPLVDGVLHVDPLADLQLAMIEVEGLEGFEGAAAQLFVFGTSGLLKLSDGLEVL